jgi:hypothetical protein
MANVVGMYGLRPVKTIHGHPYNGAGNVYYIASSEANALAPGDPVKSSGTSDANGILGITLATAGSAVRGVIISVGRALVKSTGSGAGNQILGGPMIDPTSLETTVAPATKTTAYYAFVADDPDLVFACKESSSGTAFTAAEVGLNANLAAGTNNGYVSGWYIDNSTEATTATLNVKLLGLNPVPNNAFGVDAEWLVTLNAHELRGGIAGV